MPERDDEVVPLAERLHVRATAAHEEAVAKARADLAKGDADRERLLREGSHEFYLARMEHLQDLLSQAADQGKFEWKVWSGHPSAPNSVPDEINRRGLRKVADWLIEQGFQADLVDTKDEVPDYGTVTELSLTARWSTDYSGSRST